MKTKMKTPYDFTVSEVIDLLREKIISSSEARHILDLENVSPAPTLFFKELDEQRQQPQEFLMDEQQVDALAQSLGATVNGIAPRGADYYMFNRGMLHAIDLLEEALCNCKEQFDEGVIYSVHVLHDALKGHKNDKY